MLRSTAIFTLKSCRHLTLTTRSSLKFKPLLHNSYASSYILLARNESTGAGAVADKEVLSSSKLLESQIPAAPDVTAAVTQPELVFTPVGKVVDGIASIPEPPVPVPSVIEEAIVSLAANGEPTLHSLGLGSWYPPGLVQQGLELMHCNLGMPWWAAIAAGTVILRMLLFPLVIKSQRMSAKMHNVMPQMQVIQQKMTDARTSGNQLMGT
ncbi:unnamed protein product [Allacma fusca]|uniref:Membrane insertase YidC/Oxa/ALB C-terminal domain-containing protein n=1 Tax=Allacma fusca TaxID=39272 RepID=A0A8J2LMN5_9HEXA|nr:unnamed protein product [Allacma fusca]